MSMVWLLGRDNCLLKVPLNGRLRRLLSGLNGRAGVICKTTKSLRIYNSCVKWYVMTHYYAVAFLSPAMLMSILGGGGCRVSPLSTRHRTWLPYPSPPAAAGHHWRPVQICSLEDLSPSPPSVVLTPNVSHRNMYGWKVGGTHPTRMLLCVSVYRPQTKSGARYFFIGMCQSYCSLGEGVSVWCHFLSGCLVPCSFLEGESLCLVPCSFQGLGISVQKGGVSVQKGSYVQRGSLSRGRSLWGRPPGLKPPVLWKAGGTNPTGMLSCSSLILFLLDKQGCFIQLPVHLVLWPCCHAKIFFLVREYCY